MKSFSIYRPPIVIFLPPSSSKVARWANRHSSTHSPRRVSLSQTQELPPKVMELWVHLAHGSFYFLKLKWKEWESPEHCLFKKNAASGFTVGLWELAQSQEREGGVKGISRAISLPPPVLAGSVLYWAGLGQAFIFFALISQNTRVLFSPANHNQMCPDWF